MTAITTSVPQVFKHQNVVPLKHRSGPLSAQELFVTILEKQDFSPIVRTLLRENAAKNELEAKKLIEGFLQWFSVGAVTKTKSFVMFNGSIDQVFHAMILNSKWYFHFCYKFTGVYTHHEPVQENGITDDELQDASMFTLRLLETIWGENLHSNFKMLKQMAERGEVDAKSVSCVGNQADFDIVPIIPEY